MSALRDAWFDQARSLVLSVSGSRHALAQANHLRFRASSDELRGLSPATLSGFIDRLRGEYGRKVPPTPLRFWFYAWVDEMAASLDGSAAPAESFDELPFGCRLNRANEAAAIARSYLACRHHDDIPRHEFLEGADEILGTSNNDFRWTVFARELGDTPGPVPVP